MAIVHDLPDAAGVSDICERIGIEQDKISPLPNLDRSQILIGAKYARAATGACLDRLHRS